MKVYEDDQVVIYHSQEGHDVVIVSFAHMDFPVNSGSYWGAKPLQTLGYSAIGVVAKNNDWYPPSLMKPALERVKAISDKYSEVLTYGFSMGAYAAIKYSACLQANTVIALSPQASIDPQDDKIGIYRTFFIEQLHSASGINHNDITGNVYIVYDPYMKGDAWSASFIQNLHPGARTLKAPRAQHETIDMFANTLALGSLIESCRSDDLGELHSIINKRRKTAWRRIESIMDYALSRDKDIGWRFVLENVEMAGEYVMSRLIKKHGDPPTT